MKTATEKPERETELSRIRNRLGQYIDEQRAIVQSLEKRLEEVVRNEPQANEKNPPEETSSVPLVAGLEVNCRSIRTHNDILQSLLDRLEV